MKSKPLKIIIAFMLSAVMVASSGCNTMLDLSARDSAESMNTRSTNEGSYETAEGGDNSAFDIVNGVNKNAGNIENDEGNAIEKMELYYVTGVSAPIALRESGDDKSKVLLQLEKGDSVRLVSADSGDYFYVYSEEEDTYGYLKKDYLTNQESAVCSDETYFIANKTSLYSSNDDSSTVLQTLNKNTQVKVIAKISGDYWYVYISSSKAFGYVKVLDLSSTKSEASSKTTSSATSSASVPTSTSGYYTGVGTTPTSYSLYYAKVNSGYLAVRSAQAYDNNNIIGKLYTGDSVYVIVQSGTYWYCYAPALGLYGYIDSRYLVTNQPSNSTYSYSDTTKWVVKVNTGYLALRNAASYDDSNIIGKLYTGDYVYVVSYTNYTDTYWYVYSPTLGKYGWVDSNYIFS